MRTMAKYRLVRSIAVAGLAGALSIAACQSVSGLGDLQFDKSDTPPCEDDVDCDQGNRCTTGTCDPSGTCLYVAEDDGPLAEQIDGDCRRVDCHSGQEVEVIDATDDDDGNDCTQDACEGEDASPSHTSVPDATMCVLQDGTAGYCKGGTCGSDCTEATAYLCDDANDCTIDSCDTTIG
jgi:Dictyostelium (slime mold) repeat